MTLSAPTLAAVKLALRVDQDESDSQLTRAIEAATQRANRQAPGAPQAIGDEAIIRFVAWLFESPSSSAGDDESGAWLRSGAAGMLSPWQVRRGGAIGGSDDDDDDETDGTTMTTPRPRLFTFPSGFGAGEQTLTTARALAAQGWIDDGTEITAVTRRAVSTAAPVYCLQARWDLNFSVRTWAGFAVKVSDDLPTHQRTSLAVASDVWPGRFEQASGVGVDVGVDYRVFLWPVALQTGPLQTVLEWPL